MNGTRVAERVVEQERGFVGLEIGGQDAERLQVRNLARGERDEFAEAFVEGGIRAGAQQRRHFGPRVAHEIIAVPEFVMRGDRTIGFGSMLCSERMSLSRSTCQQEACVFFLRGLPAATG